MSRILSTISLFYWLTLLSAQSMNSTLLDTWHNPSLPTHSGLKYNDCWGYTAPDGREYAILGSAGRIHFIDITDPSNVVEVQSFGNLNANGTNSLSIWRDFKTYGHYAYAVADQNAEGLIVFDLSNLPTSVSKVYQSTASFNKAHNIFIDENSGKIYIPGSDTHGNGIIVFDIATTPASPVEIAAPNLPLGYSHDIYVRNDTAYCFHGWDQAFYVYDFADPTAPANIGSLTTYSNSGYNHSGWLTEDSQYLIFCDESVGREVKVAKIEADQSAPAGSPTSLEITAQSSWYFNANLDNDPTLNNIAHNPFVKGDYVYVAYYNEGLQVWDISDPENAVLEGYYDTNTAANPGNYDGAWGCYPYFNSGTVIISDTETGLYTVRINSILPVSLASFEIQKKDKKVQLDWTTDFERNNDRFEIERSSDAVTFHKIAEIKGLGNNTEVHNYKAFDENPLPGLSYYRLKQVDFDGTYSYSSVKQIEFAQNAQVSISPTFISAEEFLTIEIQGLSPFDFEYSITDASGKKIQEGQISRFAENFLLSTADWATGIYFVHVHNKAQTLTQKVIK